MRVARMTVLVMFVVLGGLAGAAEAQVNQSPLQRKSTKPCTSRYQNCGGGSGGGGGDTVSSVPELSVGGAGVALVLLLGGALIARDRRRSLDVAR